MVSVKSPVLSPVATTTPLGATARRLAAMALRRSSLVLARLARRLAVPATRGDAAVPELEFYAEAGAPEGALYLNGRLVARLPGVKRL